MAISKIYKGSTPIDLIGKEEETKTLTPDFAGGNQVVTPTVGKVLSQVTINKDTTNHIPDNIKKDVTIYGITGTLESGGSPSTSTGGIFTGATIPLTYKDNTHTYENVYEYKSSHPQYYNYRFRMVEQP